MTQHAGTIAAGLKTAYQIAIELGVTPQALYKKIKKNKELQQLIVGEDGYRFDAEGERTIKECFGVHSEPSIEPTIEPVDQQLVERLNNEIEYLRSELDKERERNDELVQQLIELSRNNQVLLGLNQQPRGGFFQRLLTRKK